MSPWHVRHRLALGGKEGMALDVFAEASHAVHDDAKDHNGAMSMLVLASKR